VQRLTIRTGVAFLGGGGEHLGGALEQLQPPLPDLVGIDLVLLSQLD